MGIENRVNTLFRILMLALLALNCRAAIVPIQETVFTTNTFDTDIVGGAIPYFDFPSGKFVASPTAYSNALFYDPALGFLSIVHTNDTGDLLLNLAVAGAAGQSIQAYADKLVVANTNLTFDAVGPFSIRLRVNGSNVLEAVAGSISLSGKTNLVADNGTDLTYNGLPIGRSSLQALYYGAQYGFGASDLVVTNIRSSLIASNTVDIFTVPAGRRFLASQISGGTTNGSTTAYMLIKTNGVYYRFGGNVTLASNFTLGLLTSGQNFIFEAGETIAVNTTLVGANIFLCGFLFPNNLPVYSPRVTSLASGLNTIYTCPVGKCAVAMTFPTQAVVASPSLFLEYVNDSGTSRTISVYAVPSGGSADNSNKMKTVSVADKSLGTSPGFVLFPGDSLVIGTDASTATQWARLTVAEIPFP